ncbi:MAG: DedA family protein [Gammaproteobacteria bacterium]|nr:DedA family protein [Gammaproteobacteria bacterium]
MTIEQFVTDYGYLAILLWTFVEGETVVIVAGFFAHLGLLNIELVILTALLGSFSGDQLYYYIGRHGGAKYIAKRKSWQMKAECVYRILRRHQNLLIVSFRFYYGVRNITPFAIGAANIPRLRFFILNFIGATVWAVVFSYGGYFLGKTLKQFIDDYHHYALLILGGLIAIVMLASLVRKLCQSRASKISLDDSKAVVTPTCMDTPPPADPP